MPFFDDVNDADWRCYANEPQRPRPRVASPGAYAVLVEATERTAPHALSACASSLLCRKFRAK